MDCHVFGEASAILRTSRNKARVSQLMVEMVGRHTVADSAQKQTTTTTRYTAPVGEPTAMQRQRNDAFVVAACVHTVLWWVAARGHACMGAGWQPDDMRRGRRMSE